MSYESKSIRDALEEINRTYFLPAIQREFVWDTRKIEKLFDSIMGDYPIGSFLFWKIREENKNKWISYEFIKNFNQEDPHNEDTSLDEVKRDIYFILDGQQRLTALNIGLRGSYRYRYYSWRNTKLYINLLKPFGKDIEIAPDELEFQFEFRTSEETEKPRDELWYRVGDILNYYDVEDAKEGVESKLNNLSKEKEVNAKRLIGRLHSRIHTFPLINYYEEKTDDPNKVVEVFIRANTSGKQLEYSDILLSTATAKWENLNAREEIHKFTDEINKIGGGYNFGKDFILKGALFLTDNLPVQYKISNFTRDNLAMIESNWEKIKFGIESTIKLINQFGLIEKNITSTMALLPIAYYLMKMNNTKYLHSSESDVIKDQISINRWLILVLLKNSFGGSSDTTLKNLRDVLQKEELNAFPLDQLNKRLGIGFSFTMEEIEKHLSTNYRTKYSFLILSLLYPNREWKNIHIHEDHIYPKSLFSEKKLEKRGYSKEKIALYMKNYNSILNLQLLTDTENTDKGATDFSEWITTRDDNFKARHSIPELNSYDFDNFDEFISQRRKKFLEMFGCLINK